MSEPKEHGDIVIGLGARITPNPRTEEDRALEPLAIRRVERGAKQAKYGIDEVGHALSLSWKSTGFPRAV